MAPKSTNKIAEEDISGEPQSPAPSTPEVLQPDISGIEQDKAPDAMSVDSKGASSSGSSVAISIELPAVNVLDEKIKQLQRDREALKAQRKQVAKELKAKKKLAVKKARATRGLSDEMLMEEVRKRMLRRPSAASGTPETEEVSKE
jgi:hypothetical protein